MIFMIFADVTMIIAHDLGDTDQEFFITYNGLES